MYISQHRNIICSFYFISYTDFQARDHFLKQAISLKLKTKHHGKFSKGFLVDASFSPSYNSLMYRMDTI